MTQKTSQLYQKAKSLIPGGSNLFSKRPELWAPEQWPAYFSTAGGCHVADLDGNEFLDMATMGLGACVLGYADHDVDAAVMKSVYRGTATSLNCPEEVELAEVLCELHPWAQMARFTRSGGEALAVAVRIARAATGREHVVVCGYHGWHDWYMAGGGHLDGLTTAGVPKSLEYLIETARYNNLIDFEEKVFSVIGPRTPAAFVVETVRNTPPEPGFLEGLRAICDKNNIVLIFDEVSSGFRIANGGAHLHYGVNPDIAVFAKAISNGYPMAAVLGRREIMEAAQTTFISSTSWTERIGPTAALATIKKFRENDVAKHLMHTGRLIKKGWIEAAKFGDIRVKVSGIDPLAHIEFEQPDHATMFTQEMLKYGILAGKSFYPSYAHRLEHVVQYLEACHDVFHRIGLGQVKLEGPVAQSGFQRLA